MTEITLGGKERKLEITYLTVLKIEDIFDMSFRKVFETVDIEKQSNVFKLYYAVLKNEDQSTTLEQVQELIINSIMNDETDMVELSEKIFNAVDESVVVKKMTEKAKEAEAKQKAQTKKKAK